MQNQFLGKLNFVLTALFYSYPLYLYAQLYLLFLCMYLLTQRLITYYCLYNVRA